MTKELGTSREKLRVINMKDAKAHAMANGFFNKNTQTLLKETCKFVEEILYLD